MKDKYTKILSCINCSNSDLKKLEDSLKCEKCNLSFQIKNNKIYFSKNFFSTKKWDDKDYYNFDLFERTKKIDMPNIIHGPKIGDLRKYLNLNDNEIAINLGGGSNKFDLPCGPSQLNCPFIGKLPHFVNLGGLPAAHASNN